jgi:hypothetical protein
MAEKIFLELSTNGNAAFEDEPASEIARILRDAAKRIEHGNYGDGGFRLNDINGNVCGRVTIEVVDDDEDEEE